MAEVESKSQGRRRLRWILIVVLIVLSSSVFWYEAQQVTQTAPTAWQEDAQGDCAIVLTGASGRIRQGFDLLYRGSVKKLIISGVHPQASLREIMPNLPFYGGLNESDIVLERRSTTTYGNAIQSQALVEALRCRSIVLVTSTLHMHRALKTFRAVFSKEHPIVPDAVVSGALRPSTSDVMAEAAKSLFYSLWAY